MKVRIQVDNPRLSELAGVLLVVLALGTLLALVSYDPLNGSFNVAGDSGATTNWMGPLGAHFSDLVLQSIGLMGFSIPVWISILATGKFRHLKHERLARRSAGAALLTLIGSWSLGMLGPLIDDSLPSAWNDSVTSGGAIGKLLSDASIALLNVGGSVLLLLALGVIGGYLLTTARVADLFRRDRPPKAKKRRKRRGRGETTHETRVIPPPSHLGAAEAEQPTDGAPEPMSGPTPASETARGQGPRNAPRPTKVSGTRRPRLPTARSGEANPTRRPAVPPPVRPYGGTRAGLATTQRGRDTAHRAPPPSRDGGPPFEPNREPSPLPQSSLLNPSTSKPAFNESQLQETAGRVVGKFEEFGVRGEVSQINPGPVVTTFEFKPDRGIKYSKIVNLAEDLCLALRSESIRVERIPGKATVGIEVPNKQREIISLREVVDSKKFSKSKSMLNFALGKDIDGRIHCADLAGMPHLLVAGQTGSGKSVMINCVIMSILLRASPEQVRLILVDPKTVELGLYRDIPHLLTPVITDMKLATNALKNATREMERRLQLLAKFGVRNISQFNLKCERATRSGKEADPELSRLPFIVVIVDELADLMIVAGRQVEESIQRLAQMARAVGIHLILATQRPSVDVITGLIKANIPARLSFLVATRVDSRTILDSMGAESLLGKGDMLFLPPGVGRQRRYHGPLVTEEEIEAVVGHWKSLAEPAYENEYLQATDEGEGGEGDDGAIEDPKYQEAVRVVLEMGKASTSALQRRLRLGYGRAARILDAMQKEGIIGPPDGSRPREVLKRPDWLD